MLASAALKFQLVGDLLEETVAVHVQFRAGALPLTMLIFTETPQSDEQFSEGVCSRQGIWKLEQLFDFIRK